MPALGLALGLPFSQRLEGLFPSGVVQWLAAPDSDGAITDKRSLLSRPVYTGNNCKKFDGAGDKLVCNTALNVGTSDFEMGIRFRCQTDPMVLLTSCIWGDGTNIGGTMANKGRVLIVAGGGGIYPYVNSTMGNTYYNGATPGAPITIGSSMGITNYHTLIIKRVGTSLQWIFNGVVRTVVTCLASDEFFVGRKPSIYLSNPEVTHAWFDIAGTRVVEYTFASGPSLTEWNRVGNSAYDGTYTTTSGIDTMATTSDKATPWNILNGFSLYTHDTLPALRVPYDINGDPLSITPPTGYTLVSEHPGGYLHNGAESTITQTDNFFIDGTINFYSADGATQDDKTYTDFLAHEPFKDNLLLQWKSVGGVCLGCEAMQLPLAYTWTKAKYNAALAFMHKFTSDCGAKIFTVTEPTGGWLRTYDPNTATAGDAYDFLATLVHDMHTGFQTYAVTEPTGGWARTFDPLDADLTLGTVQDVLATVAHDIGSTVQAYALNTGGTELYTYNPNTATFNNAANVLYSLMLKLKHFRFIL